MLKKRLCIFVTALVVAGSLIITGSVVPAAAAKTLKIGVIHSLTGLGSEIETVMRNGEVLCQEWLNEKGGITIKGEKYLIELIVEDQKGVVDGAVAAATKLVHKDKVNFIVGQVVPDVIMAAASVTEPAKVLRSLCWGGAPGEFNTYTFRSVMSAGELIPVNYEYLAEAYPNVKTIALMNPDEPGGQALMPLSEQQAQAHGIKVVAKEFHGAYEQQDFYPIWTKILATKPDAVDAGTGFPIPSALKLKQGRELGFKGPIFASSPVELYTILDIAGKKFSDNYFNTSMDIEDPNLPPMIKEIKKRWEAKFRSRFMFESSWGWDALWCMVQAIEAAQSLDTTKVSATWEKMKSIEASFGTGYMGGLKAFGFNHLVVRPCPISKLVKGKVKLIKWHTPRIP